MNNKSAWSGKSDSFTYFRIVSQNILKCIRIDNDHQFQVPRSIVLRVGKDWAHKLRLSDD